MPKQKEKPLQDCLRETNVIQKSTPMQSLWKSSLGLGEFKVLDTYLSRIDSHRPERREVMFTKEEFEKLLGISEVKPSALKQYTKALQKEIIEIDDPSCAGGFNQINLFSQSKCYRDEYGQYWLSMSCSPEAMKYVFNVDELGYLRYRLRNVLQITSRYSYVMFLYLLKRKPIKTFEVSVDDLRDLLGCAGDPLYDEFKYFNQRILRRCADEINEKTELRYEYEPVRAGRRVKFIRFTIKGGLPEIDVSEADDGNFEKDEIKQLSIDEEYVPDPTDSFKNDRLAFLAGAVDCEFDEAEMQLLSDALIVALPKATGTEKDALLHERYQLLSRCYHNLELRCRRPDLKPVKNRLKYLVELVENEKKD